MIGVSFTGIQQVKIESNLQRASARRISSSNAAFDRCFAAAKFRECCRKISWTASMRGI
jgi:hypothetical protein